MVPRPCILVALTVAMELLNSSIVIVDAFGSILNGATETTSGTRLQARTEIRDWRSSDDEPRRIYDILSGREEYDRGSLSSAASFDPEGPLDLDVANESTLKESYSEEGGGCFLVAVEDGVRIVGTLGMISGARVSYRSLGSSFSDPGITAAVRRACALRLRTDGGKAENTNEILEKLIQKGEERALRAGATEVIGLAYEENYERKEIVKPTASLLESLGYKTSQQQIPGGAAIQYEKKLSKKRSTSDANTTLESTTGTARGGEWIVPTAIALIVSIAWLVFNLFSNVFGIEQFWGSVDNGGVGTSLSTESLQELIRNEKLGRSGLDDGMGSPQARQWEDLSPEELREEQALMKVIQGQSIRTK